MGMLQTEVKILKEKADISKSVTEIYNLVGRQLGNAEYDKYDVFEVNAENFDEIMDRQETYAQDDTTRQSLKTKMEQRRLLCVEIDW
jgi:hypothetical protein